MSEFRRIAVALATFIPDSHQLLAAVDAVMRVSLHEHPLVAAALGNEEVISNMVMGKKIDAIKVLRTQTSCGLKEAKDAVEHHAVSEVVRERLAF